MTTKFQIGDRVVLLDGRVGTVIANTISSEGISVLVKMKTRRTFDERELQFADFTTVSKVQALNAANAGLLEKLTAAHQHIADSKSAAAEAARVQASAARTNLAKAKKRAR